MILLCKMHLLPSEGSRYVMESTPKVGVAIGGWTQGVAGVCQLVVGRGFWK